MANGNDNLPTIVGRVQGGGRPGGRGIVGYRPVAMPDLQRSTNSLVAGLSRLGGAIDRIVDEKDNEELNRALVDANNDRMGLIRDARAMRGADAESAGIMFDVENSRIREEYVDRLPARLRNKFLIAYDRGEGAAINQVDAHEREEAMRLERIRAGQVYEAFLARGDALTQGMLNLHGEDPVDSWGQFADELEQAGRDAVDGAPEELRAEMGLRVLRASREYVGRARSHASQESFKMELQQRRGEIARVQSGMEATPGDFSRLDELQRAVQSYGYMVGMPQEEIDRQLQGAVAKTVSAWVKYYNERGEYEKSRALLERVRGMTIGGNGNGSAKK